MEDTFKDGASLESWGTSTLTLGFSIWGFSSIRLTETAAAVSDATHARLFLVANEPNLPNIL